MTIRSADRLEETVVITFNYDLVLDQALSHVGMRPDYHLNPEIAFTNRRTGEYVPIARAE